MLNIKLKDYSSLVKSEWDNYTSYYIPINFEFRAGKMYRIIDGDQFITCLTKQNKCYDGEIFLNNEKLDVGNTVLEEKSFTLGRRTITEIDNDVKKTSAKECIEKALKLSDLTYDASEIAKMFNLSKTTLETNLFIMKKELWNVSAAIGFSLGKEIFCYNNFYKGDCLHYLDKYTIQILKKNGKIVLIATDKFKMPPDINSLFDRTLNLTNRFAKIKNINIMKKLKCQTYLLANRMKYQNERNELLETLERKI